MNISTTLRLVNIAASYDGATPVLHDLSLDIKGGEMVALLGPSGCGKTTALKIIAGLLYPTNGDVLFGGVVFTQVPAEKRGVAMVFQKPLLFPYFTVRENVAFGLKMRKTAKHEITQRVSEALRLVQLEGYEQRRPKELSGGQEQRVALARALIIEPRVLLLDEPFSALDVSLRAEMRTLVRNLQQRLQITTVFVTHDQEEAAGIADRIALLIGGRLEQFSLPREYYVEPKTPDAARFFGWKVVAGERCGNRVETAIGDFAIPTSAVNNAAEASAVIIAFHPSQVRLAMPSDHSVTEVANTLTGRLESVVDLGIRQRYTVALRSGDSIEIEKTTPDGCTDASPLSVGSEVSIYLSQGILVWTAAQRP